MTAGYTFVDEVPPSFASPTLIVALAGWIDASGAAAAAMATLESECNAKIIAVFDGDTFIDYRARRPTMELRDGVNTRLVWPHIELKAGRDLNGNDVLLLTGPEPDMAWRRFATEVAEVGGRLGVSKVVALGAYPFATPHTRDSRLSISTPSVEIARATPLLKSSIDVPAGVASLLEHAFHDRGIDALGIWVQVPHYVSSMAYPAATVALLCGLLTVSGVNVDGAAPRRETIIQRQRLDELVAGNAEHGDMVRQLESLFDAAEHASDTSNPLVASEIPSADELGAELEQFLREQGGM